MPAEAGIRFGPYILQRRIARGGMAEVFLAQQRGPEGFDRRVAVKRILPHRADAPDFIQMFLGEARLAAQLTHPNIVHIYDFGKVEADHFIAMEYVDGVHAGDVIRRGEADRLSPTMVARIGADAAAALHHAHELRAPGGKPYGLVHRDVSPANLMLSFDGVVKLCDFGIAKAVAFGDQPLTHAGTVKGKYAYMSPEQTVGMALDGRSDVYTLAIVMWELLVGRTLVPRGDAVAAMRAIRGGKLTPLEQAAPSTPGPLAEAITWGLATDREQRPTAAQLARALEAFIKSSPEIATPMQLGSWLRERFPRESTDRAGTPAVTHATLATASTASTASTPSAHPAAAPPTLFAADPPPATRFAHDAAAAPTLLAADPPPGARPPGPELSSGPGQMSGQVSGQLSGQISDRMSGQISDRISGRASSETGFLSTEPPGEAPIFAPRPPTEPPPAGPPASSTVALEHAETLLRSGAFRPFVATGAAAVPTLLDSRPAQLRGSPMLGMPVLPEPLTPLGPPRIPIRPAVRLGLVIAGLCSLALLSFAIALGVRGGQRPPAMPSAALAPGDPAPPAPAGPAAPATPPGTSLSSVPAAVGTGTAPAPAVAGTGTGTGTGTAPTPAVAASGAPAVVGTGPTRAPGVAATVAAPDPLTAAPDTATPSVPRAPASAPGVAPAGPAEPGTMATLDVHTTPAGATVLIRRCRQREGDGKCRVDRSSAEVPIGDCPAAPCTFALPVGSYEIVVELDGSRETRTVELMGGVATSLDILFKPARRPGSTGKLTVRTAQSCRAVLDGHTRVQTPLVGMELKPGLHKLELQCSRRPATTWNLTVTAGKTTNLQLTPR